MKHHLKFLLAMFVLCLTFTQVALGQETTARISGQVTDQTGAVVNNAEVALTNPQTREVRTARTDDNGYYSLTLITPGRYDLSVKVQGFKQYLDKDLELNVNDHKTINIAL